MQTLLICNKGSASFASTLARRIRAPCKEVLVSRFPDGELKLRIPPAVKNNHAVIVYSMQPNPNESLIEILFAIAACRQMAAKKVTLVIPYLGFMRQDKMFHAGEAVSNRIVAELLSSADRIITMDPHLHRIKSLAQIFTTKTTTLTADRIIAAHMRTHHKNAIVVGPDEESAQWAAIIAKRAGLQSIILKKKRYSAEKVKVVVKTGIALKGKNVVLVDDIISTGHTLIEPIKQLKKQGAKSITCIGIHGIFAEHALQKLKKLGCRVKTTNTIKNPAAAIDVTKSFAEEL